MFDTGTILLGILVLMVILSIIITFIPRKPQLTYDQWFFEVQKVFLKNGFASSYAEQLCKRDWEDYYKDGLSPREAVNAYLHL